MQRQLLIAVVILLALGAVAMSWLSRTHAADRSPMELEPAPADRGGIDAAVGDSPSLPIPSAAISEPAQIATASIGEPSRRRPVRLPARPDYAVLYAQVPRQELPQRFADLQARIQRVESAQFDLLHANFDELFATGCYGARVTEPGKAFDNIEFEISCSRDYSARTVELPDGSFVMHVLEFDRAREPATAELVAELEWVRGRIKGAH